MAKTKTYNKLKLKISKWVVAKALSKIKPNTKACSLEQASSIGVTFAATSQKDLEVIKKLLKELSAKGIKTFALGYIPEKKPSDFYLSEKAFNFFYDKELDWLLRPNSASALEFQSTKFDVLIDFGSISFYPMQVLIIQSNAQFKVGQYMDNSPFDLMINLKNQNDFRYYFDQVVHYLSKFNK